MGDKFLLQNTGLGIGPVKNGGILPGTSLFHNVGNNALRFIICRVKQLYTDFFSSLIFCPESLILSSFIITDHLVSRAQDRLCGAVILFQLNDPCARKRLLKAQYILYIGSAEPVNGLIVVSHHTDVPVFGGQKAHKPELGRIGILILVYHDVTESFLVVLQNLRMGFKELHRFHQQVIEIQGIILFQPHLVFLIQLRDLLAAGQAVFLALLGKFLRCDKLILGCGNDSQNPAFFIQFSIDFPFLKNLLHQRFLIVTVVNGKA